LIVWSGTIFYRLTFFDALPFTAAILTTVVAAEVAGGIPTYVHYRRDKLVQDGSGNIKVLIDIVVPVALTATIAFGLDAADQIVCAS
jgi:hypothetical protein